MVKIIVKIIFVALLLVASPALAQQQQSTAIDRISLAFGQCVGTSEQRLDEIADLRKQLFAAQVRIKELEPKPADRPAE